MFLTNLDTIIISLFLGSGIILMTLFGLLLIFKFKYKESNVLLFMFFRLTISSIVSLFAYGFILLFRWPRYYDLVAFAIMSMLLIWYYFKLFSVFREFIKFWIIFIGMFLIIVNYIVLVFQIITNNNSLILLISFISLLMAINLHFLIMFILIKFEKVI